MENFDTKVVRQTATTTEAKKKEKEIMQKQAKEENAAKKVQKLEMDESNTTKLLSTEEIILRQKSMEYAKKLKPSRKNS